MKQFILLVSMAILSVDVWSLTKINVDYFAQESLFIYRDQAFVVPECRKVLVQDISQLGENAWLEIEGIVQIAENFNFSASPSHFLNGKFTYSTRSGLPKQKIVVYAKSKIILRSINEEARAPIEQFSWIGDGDCKN
jgi:hypothetical protein